MLDRGVGQLVKMATERRAARCRILKSVLLFLNPVANHLPSSFATGRG